MKIIATILCISMLVLFIQPALFPVRVQAAKKEMPCCAKKHHKERKDDCGGEKDCCGGGKCNPLFSQCPICAVAAITQHGLQLPIHNTSKTPIVFTRYTKHLISSYLADLLRPPIEIA